jgi:ligand-binding SRPBCC domain-containing protein
MTTHKISRKQFLPITRNRAWDFFSSPRNLSMLTPRRVKVEIRKISGGYRIYEGQVVVCRFFALHLIPLDWETVVTDVKHHECFTYRQTKGPYASWVHRHSFKTVPGGIEIQDDIEYALPLGWIGRLSNSMIVRRELEEVFNYRSTVLQEYFAHPQDDVVYNQEQSAVSASLPVTDKARQG